MDGGGGERAGERSFACLEAEDTWGIKDVRRSNTLILKGGGGIKKIKDTKALPQSRNIYLIASLVTVEQVCSNVMHVDSCKSNLQNYKF